MSPAPTTPEQDRSLVQAVLRGDRRARRRFVERQSELTELLDGMETDVRELRRVLTEAAEGVDIEHAHPEPQGFETGHRHRVGNVVQFKVEKNRNACCGNRGSLTEPRFASYSLEESH